MASSSFGTKNDRVTVTKIRGIMLDFYGTLVDEDDDIVPLTCEEVRRGIPVTAITDASGPTATGIGRFWWDLFRARFQVSFDETFVDQRTLGLDSLNDTAAVFASTCDSAAIIEKPFPHWLAPPIFPDAVPFLAEVRSLRMPICVVSNIDRRDIEAVIAFHGLQFDGLVTSEDARAQAYKSRPKMFHMALDVLGLQPNEVLLVEDSRTSDVGGAARLGIAVAWVNRTGKSATGDPVADFMVTWLNEVLTIVRS